MRTRHLGALLLAAAVLRGQVSTRGGQIEAAPEKKSQRPMPEKTGRLEQAVRYIKERKILEWFTGGIGGFRVRLGGLVSGSGLALGPEYLRRDLAGGGVAVRGSVRASLKRYQLYEVELGFPKLAGEKAFVDLYAVHRNYPRIDYYGPGPESQKSGRSDYRLEDEAYEATAGVKPVKPLRLGVTAGYLEVNVGPGADGRFVSAEKIFPPSGTPGIDRQADFWRVGAFAQYDWRDDAGRPRQGGNYLVRYSRYADRRTGVNTFGRVELEAQQYVPVFSERQVIALRGRSVLTDDAGRHRVPFYLQPTLGGSEDLRGFRRFRFYDDHMMVFNAEYRWASINGMDAAVFADAGKVFHRREQWNLKDLESAVGFGLRFNVDNKVFLRVDVGFSHEGFQVWVKLNNVY